MAYKILYVEDLHPGSIVHDLKQVGFDSEHLNPESLDQLISEAKNYNLLLLDFRLTENRKIIFDAPTIAQTVRTINGTSHLDIPIVLMSTEGKITDFYRDFSSHDLFDLSVEKRVFSENIEKYAGRFQDLIEAYNIVGSSQFNVANALGISEDRLKSIDYRISEQLGKDTYKDIFAFTTFILKQVVKSIGILIGEDVVAARFGVNKTSPNWKDLLASLDNLKYKGIFSNSYPRWWADEIDSWWKSNIANTSLRRLSAETRVELLKGKTGLDLHVQNKTVHATSSNYWTICKELNLGIDSIDGLELNQRDLKPWQEKEYISLQAGLEASDLTRFVKSFDRERLSEFASKL